MADFWKEYAVFVALILTIVIGATLFGSSSKSAPSVPSVLMQKQGFALIQCNLDNCHISYVFGNKQDCDLMATHRSEIQRPFGSSLVLPSYVCEETR